MCIFKIFEFDCDKPKKEKKNESVMVSNVGFMFFSPLFLRNKVNFHILAETTIINTYSSHELVSNVGFVLLLSKENNYFSFKYNVLII